MSAAVCPSCNAPLAADAQVCTACDERLDQAPAARAPLSRAAGLSILVVCLFGLCVAWGLCVLFDGTQRLSNRTRCKNNLRQLGLASIQYADDQRRFPHVAGAGALDGDQTTSDSPKITRALVYYGYHDNPEGFVCLETSESAFSNEALETAPRTWFWGGKTVADSGVGPLYDGQPDPALAGCTELSYGWTRRALALNAPSDALLAADRAIRVARLSRRGSDGTGVDGWVVVTADGSTPWVEAPAAELASTDPTNRKAGFLSIDASGP